MGLLDMTAKEKLYYERNSNEAFDLLGYDVLFYQLVQKDIDIYQDPTNRYLPPVKVNISFQAIPEPNYKYGKWQKEMGVDEFPWEVLIPTTDENGNRLKVEEHCKFELRTKMDFVVDNEQVNSFKITKVTGSKIDPMFWQCKVIPYRHKVDINPSTPQYDKYKTDKKIDDSVNMLNIEL